MGDPDYKHGFFSSRGLFWKLPPGRALAWFMRNVLRWDSSVGE